MEYPEHVRASARFMRRELAEYELATSKFIVEGDLKRIYSRSLSLLHDLGEENPSDDELSPNGDAMRGMIRGLHALVSEGRKLPSTESNFRSNYDQVIGYMEEVKVMLSSVL